MSALPSQHPLHAIVEFTEGERDKLLWREWSGRHAPRPRFDPVQILSTIYGAGEGHERTSAVREAAAIVNQLAVAWDFRAVRLDARDLVGTADRAAAFLIDAAAQSRTPSSIASRAMLLELLLSIEQLSGRELPESIYPDPFAPSRLALTPPWAERDVLDRLETLVLEVGDNVLHPAWPSETFSDLDASDLWPHVLLVEWARQVGRLDQVRAAAQRKLPAYALACAEDGAEVLVPMLARLGFPIVAQFVIGSSLRVVGKSAHPVAVELVNPQARPPWWDHACLELLHLASCRQISVVHERWITPCNEGVIRLDRPHVNWCPEDERALAESDAGEALPY